MTERDVTAGRWIGDPGVHHGEGAFWDARAGVLRHVDMNAGDIVTIADDGSTARAHISDVVAVVRARRSGGYVAATERGFALLDEELAVLRRIEAFDDPGVRMNEGGCDPEGRFYCGSMAYDQRPGGGILYRLDPDLSVQIVLPAVTIPNGLVWIDGGRAALHADTPSREIRVYDVDPETGAFGASRLHVSTRASDGAPDGFALDEHGGIWVALFGGGAVHHYDAAGELREVIPLPVSNPTSCAFGGPDGTTLFITTSKEDIDPRAQPRAGQVFAIEVGVRGAPVHAFAG